MRIRDEAHRAVHTDACLLGDCRNGRAGFRLGSANWPSGLLCNTQANNWECETACGVCVPSGGGWCKQLCAGTQGNLFLRCQGLALLAGREHEFAQFGLERRSKAGGWEDPLASAEALTKEMAQVRISAKVPTACQNEKEYLVRVRH